MYEEQDGRGVARSELSPGIRALGNGLMTPEEVRATVFATVRLREGYDLAQVDAFTGRVEIVLAHLLQENAHLSARLAERSGDDPPQPPAEGAVQVIGLAKETADRVLIDASREAQQIIAEARTTAETLEAEAREQASRAREARDHYRAGLDQLDSVRAAEEQRLGELGELITRYRDHLAGDQERPTGQLRPLLEEFEALEEVRVTTRLPPPPR
ncbi:DivIVA domain-containing protein [Spirillospora sp. NPDC047279]|uniref:DivIVA domain-containing protein n=1 Tax=Spirillospora sp. NPDC047279 TaxID=3155478 RepID=UPI0033FF6599